MNRTTIFCRSAVITLTATPAALLIFYLFGGLPTANLFVCLIYALGWMGGWLMSAYCTAEIATRPAAQKQRFCAE